MNNIIVIDDHILLRDMICDTLEHEPEFHIVATASDASEAPALCEEHKPALVLMDVCTENNSNGISYGRLIKEQHPEIKVIIMTSVLDVSFINDSKAANIDSFIYKNISKDSLIATIKSTLDGYSLYPNTQANPATHKNILSDLTDKELEILISYSKLLDREAVANAAGISISTLKSHIASIYEKTGYDNLTKLTIHCISNGFINPNLED